MERKKPKLSTSTDSGGDAASAGKCRCLVITANLGTLFEQYDVLVDIWVNMFAEEVTTSAAQFVALHIQETGGKNYKEDMVLVPDFIKRLRSHEKIAAAFDRSFTVIDSDVHGPQFTALGNVYFVRRGIDAKIWSFDEESFVDQIQGHTDIDSETTDDAKLALFRRERFPPDFYPQTKWSRKGYCVARWLLNGKKVDLVNVHLFHDASNITAMEQQPSVYASNRARALGYVADKIEGLQTGDTFPTIYFGDFNFRLALAGVAKHFAGEASVESEVDDEGNVTKSIVKDPADDNNPILVIKPKKFLVRDQSVFLHEHGEAFRKFDVEANTMPESIVELPVTFEPSYPYAEDVDVPQGFLVKRCPGWCDRILMSSATRELISPVADNAYTLFGRDVCTGDHKPIRLLFDL